jgi:hypothetical protein
LDPSLVPASTVLDSGVQADNADWQTHELTASAAAGERALILRMRCKGGDTDGTGTDTAYWFQVLDLDYPAEADVENGVDYANGELTGTLVVGGGGGAGGFPRRVFKAG